ncbi:GTP cyclohydrolase I [Mesosutterella sp. OilRF-GAM-744-9]|uniref:GTP cyclohydrolase I n=2 Tax=Mesosutterella TaxID=2494213 RepID=A0ABS9MQ27_9BURK|nr:MULTISPECIES: GTP cyclohydrolase I [unclassified Mesosutterella]MCG5030502.1 GTP cyclohydrolase I [Mesosutterella sp. oilRF-744-WT-GAM-9]MCI6531224.1 GTP cyclohydrolase I [Mesosutterella sp.]MDL2059350.1 GTP cyclohydrolase I [Mesosutterella sp. AGMB02718]
MNKSAGKLISDIIRERLQKAGADFCANDNIAEYLQEGDLERLQQEVEERVQALLGSLVIDTERDPNTRETAHRIAKMYLQEVFAGRYAPRPKITEFPNTKNLDQVYTVGPVTVRSACSHHFVPVIGQCWIGVIPSGHLIGISKFSRLAQWVFSRPQIQEEATVQLADELERLIHPHGLAVIVRARHECMSWRGVKENDCAMTTSVMRGYFLKNTATRMEFLSLIRDPRG